MTVPIPSIDERGLYSYNSQMKTVNISKLKNQLSAIIDTLPATGPILVVDRNIPKALLSPANGSDANRDARLLRLARSGVVQPQTGTLPESIWLESPPRLANKVDAVAILLAERESGR